MAVTSSRSTGSFTHFTQRRVREFFGIGWIVLAVALLLSLASYDSLDPSTNVASHHAINNWMGAAGAIMADLLLQSFGLASFLIVFTMLGWGWRQLVHHAPLYFLLRAGNLLLALLLAGYLCHLLPYPGSWPIQAGLGGAYGSLIAAQLPTQFGFVALTVLVGLPAMLFFWAISTGIKAEEWKNILLLLSFLCILCIRKVFEFIRLRPKVSFSGYELPQEGRFVDKIRQLVPFSSGAVDPDEDLPEKPTPKRKPHRKAPAEKEESKKQEPKVQKRSKVGEQTSLLLGKREGGYTLPDTNLLKEPPKSARKQGVSDSSLRQNAKLLESVLHDFGVKGDIVGIHPGPVVTLYELEPAAGTKSSRVIGLADDIARSMSAVSARISVIPGRNAMGIELPNTKRETVYFRELLETTEFADSQHKLPMALGKDIGGAPIIVDLAKMPHLLVAGTTGSGKSVSINTMIASLLYAHTPDTCKFIMIDPKMLELSVYEGIPHLLAPVVTEPPKAVVALKWVVKEMENRYRSMANLGVRNMEGYNKRIRAAKVKGEELKRTVQTGFDPETGKPIYEDQPLDMNPLPFIVVVVDEMADLMLVAGKDIEGSVQRLAQMARAAGIHIIMATQRPSVDVITGVVKANFPTRISFQVTSRIDSRTILGEQGAEQLLGMGDMLYMAGGGRVTRVHGPFVSDKEVDQLVTFLKSQGEPEYVEEVTLDPEEDDAFFEPDASDEETMLYQKAVAIVKRDNKASTSYLQRCLRIGYNRAARLIDQMEEEGLISAPNHAGKREVL